MKLDDIIIETHAKDAEKVVNAIKKLPEKTIERDKKSHGNYLGAGIISATGEVCLKLKEKANIYIPENSKNIRYKTDIREELFVPCIKFNFECTDYLITGL
jgi:hypothetical protein